MIIIFKINIDKKSKLSNNYDIRYQLRNASENE